MAKSNNSGSNNPKPSIPKPSTPKPTQAPTGNTGTRGGDKGNIIKK
jgi:hypothetical protein